MQLNAFFPSLDIGSDPAKIRDWAQAAEDLGYAYIEVPDHVFGATARDGWVPLYDEKASFHETFVTLGFLAAVTKTIRLVWEFLCQGCITPFLSCFVAFILLFDPRREHSSVPTAHCRRRRAQRRSRTALLQRRRRLVLDGREHGGRLPLIGVSAARIPGGPAIGREQSREPRLDSVEPTLGLDHEAGIRFGGQGSEAAGPFSQRHCSPSRMRIAATSDRHPLPGPSNAGSCRTPFVLSRSRGVVPRVVLTPPAATPP